MKVDFFNLKEQYQLVYPGILEAIVEIFSSQKFILGKNVLDFETKFAAYCGTQYAVAVSSGTDALLAALMALEIGAGDEVILPDFTFFATAGAIARLGAKPVFVDIDPNSFNISSSAVRKAITTKTKAIIPVHLFGQCANMDAIREVSEGVPLIEDTAQCVGTQYQNGKKAGNLGLMGCFSFYPTKNLGGAGDSGAITTNDEKLYKRLLQMRNHGMEPRYLHAFIGGNFRMDEIQAAVLNIKLQYVDIWNHLRCSNSLLYKTNFTNMGLVKDSKQNTLSKTANVVLPLNIYTELHAKTLHTYHQYCILANKRDELRQYLAGKEIGTDIYYPIPLHKQKCFAHYGYNDAAFPVTNYVCEHILALPIYPEIPETHITEVVSKIAEFYHTILK